LPFFRFAGGDFSVELVLAAFSISIGSSTFCDTEGTLKLSIYKYMKISYKYFTLQVKKPFYY
jgi:hypothetical protein